MAPQKYRIKLSDGREFDVTTEGGPPSESDVMKSLSIEPKPGLFKEAWTAASTPVVNLRGEPGSFTRERTEEFAKENPIIGGASNFAMDMISGLSSPLNLAFGGLGAGEVAGAKLGLPAVAKLSQIGRRLLSVPVAAEGAQNIYEGMSGGGWGQGLMGGLELGGGILGIRKGNITPISARTSTEIPTSFESGLERGAVAPRMTQEATGLPVRPPVNPQVAKAVAGELKPESITFEDIPGPKPIDVAFKNPDSIHTAYAAGKIDQKTALGFLKKLHQEEIAASSKKAAPIETPVTEPTPKPTNVTYVIPKNRATPEFIRNAQKQGYKFLGLSDNGDFRFKKIGPVADITKMGESTKQPVGIPEATELIKSGEVRNVADLQRRTGLSFEKTREIWNESKRNLQEALQEMEADIPGIKPHDQLPTPPMVGEVIKAIPKTGNEELDNMVRALRAMRRRKGIDEFNEIETQAYNGLMNEIKNHPDLPEGLRKWWNIIEPSIATSRPTLVSSKTGILSKFGSEKGELVIRQGKETIGDIEVGKVIIVKTNQGTPAYVKMLYDKGFRFLGENEAGNLRFKKTVSTEQAPILEEEIGSARPTKRAIIGELGPIQDAKKSSVVMEAFNLPRGILASWDFSAPLRQGLPLIHKKAFWTSLEPMFKSWASEEGFQASQNSIANRSLFKKRIGINGEKLPSFADDAGLKLTDLTDLSKREEAIMSTWAEKVPMVRPSNRAYTSFLNNLRADVFESLIKDGNILADIKTNLPLARSLADFVNTASGRGSLGRLEASATILNTGLFAPRLIAARLKMLNPAYYIMAPPQVRREALKSLFAIAATGNTVLQLAKMAGAEVGTDPNSSDFGKAKIGNVRIDPWGGFQQYIVAANRLIRPGFAAIPGLEGGTDTGLVGLDLATGFLGKGGQKVTSSTSGREYDLWNPRGPYDPTHLTIGSRFLRGKTNPVINFAWSILSGQKEMSGQPMNFTTMNPMENAIAQRFIPILMQDIYQLAKENPELLPLAIPAAFGMGIQTYENKQ